MRRPKKSERGSIIVEFLMVFPAFLVLAMFVLEASLMWSDRHIERLAAFEAARVFASANLPEFENGNPVMDPCRAPEAKKRAKQAALRKMAIVTPPLPLFLAKLGKEVSGLNFGTIPSAGDAGDAMMRLAKRWPTAVASTEVNCSFDAKLKQVDVKVTYHRMLQTPLIDRVIYTVYRLGQVNKSAPVELSLDENFLSVTAASESGPAVSQMRQQLRKSLDTVKQLDLSPAQAVNYMRDVPGVDSVFKQVTAAPQDILKTLGDMTSEAQKDGKQALGNPLVGSGLDQQAKLLTSLVGLVPEALRRIPMTVQVSLQRDVFTSKAITSVSSGQEIKEPRWEGHMEGVFDMDGTEKGQFRKWGFKMSEPLVNLRTDATPMEKVQ